MYTTRIGGLAQSVECVVSNDEAPGSKPGFSTFFCPNGVQYHTQALVAQMVERKTLNLVVVGSIPTEGAFLVYIQQSRRFSSVGRASD